MTKDELITNNINLIKYCIKKMNLKWLTKDEFQEYYDDGLLGLVKGSEQYDESKGKPSTYLYKTIKNEICRGMYLRSRNKRCNPFGRDVSLNTLVGDTNEQTELEDFIPDLDVDIEKTVQNKLEIERILYAVNHLKNEKNKLAIKMYFGLEDYTPSTYKNIAQKFNVSPEAIRVKVSSGIKKVREYLDKNEREAFVKEELKKEADKKLNPVQRLIKSLADVFVPVLPILVAAGTNTGFGLTERAAVFLPGTMIVGGFAIFVHSQSSITDQVTCRKSFALGIAFFEGDKSFPIIDRFHGVVDDFHIVALVGKEGAFFQRNRLIRSCEDISGDGGIGDIARRGQLVERQAGDAVHQHMAFVSPVELIPPIIVLVGGRMDAQSAVRVAFGVVFLGELAFRKGLRIVLLRVCHDGCGIQTNERRIHHAQLIQLPHQIGHDRLQRTVVQLPQAAVIRPVGRQRLHDIEPEVPS